MDKSQEKSSKNVDWFDNDPAVDVSHEVVEKVANLELREEITNSILNSSIVPLGCCGEVGIFPDDGKSMISPRTLPPGCPPVTPSVEDKLNSILNLENLPSFHLDNVQKFLLREPDVESLYDIGLCNLPTTINFVTDFNTGDITGYVEDVVESLDEIPSSSTSMFREPDLSSDVMGDPSNIPFWPGGMEVPEQLQVNIPSLDLSILDEEYLDTPPGFEHGMKFERKPLEEIDYINSEPSKIYLSDILEMEDDSIDMSDSPSMQDTYEVDNVIKDIEEKEVEPQMDESITETFDRIKSLPVLNISDNTAVKEAKYEWAVIEDASEPVESFYEIMEDMAFEYDFLLDTFQRKAILHLEQNESVLVAAHTSAGKTVVAEYAIALARKHSSRVIYTSPIKALSNQKYRDFTIAQSPKSVYKGKPKFEDVGIVTGDVQINPTAFCLIMTTEILRSMLYNGSDMVRELEWVIFDEVHYINDPERGVVWEEVFIMLPDNVKLLMLSATVPNTAEFAEWLGRIKKKKIYVISTLTRPVPLVHNLYTGSVGKASVNDMFLIVDKMSKYLSDGYEKALQSKKTRSSGQKGQQHHSLKLAQEKNVYISLLNHLKMYNLLPCVVFTFSRRRCNEHAQMLLSQDLTTNEEKNKIKEVFRNSLSGLKPEDRQLPQVLMMENLLRQGFGIHHSGILPILKEVVEILFHDELIKVLFATETFAMGVNMPARSVVFDSVRKHDGFNFRDLQPSEYIQMAGRAGRRGKDTEGTVIILCKGDIPEARDLHRITCGKPTKLVSQFRLTYRMILNLLKVKSFRVEDIIKNSFLELDIKKVHKKLKERLEEAKERLKNCSRPDCSLCNTDLEKYIDATNEIIILKRKTMPKLCIQAPAKIDAGRVLIFSNDEHQNIPGIILSNNRKDSCQVLAIQKKNFLKDESNPKSSLVWSKEVFYPTDRQPKCLVVRYEIIQTITANVIKVKSDAILKEIDAQGSRLIPGNLTADAFQDLCNLCEKNLSGFKAENITMKEIELSQEVVKIEQLERSILALSCVKCPNFPKHFSELHSYFETEKEINACEYQLSEQNLTLHPEFNARKEVLRKFNFIDEKDEVSEKGKFARLINDHELVITEIVTRSLLTACDADEVAALLSCMVFQQKSDIEEDLAEVPQLLQKTAKEIIAIAEEIDKEQRSRKISEPNFLDQCSFHLVHVVHQWMQGKPFAQIMETTDVDEGIIVRGIVRLCELMKDIETAAKIIGVVNITDKMQLASVKIKRDIAFLPSLYTPLVRKKE